MVSYSKNWNKGTHTLPRSKKTLFKRKIMIQIRVHCQMWQWAPSVESTQGPSYYLGLLFVRSGEKWEFSYHVASKDDSVFWLTDLSYISCFCNSCVPSHNTSDFNHIIYTKKKNHSCTVFSLKLTQRAQFAIFCMPQKNEFKPDPPAISNIQIQSGGHLNRKC